MQIQGTFVKKIMNTNIFFLFFEINTKDTSAS